MIPSSSPHSPIRGPLLPPADLRAATADFPPVGGGRLPLPPRKVSASSCTLTNSRGPLACQGWGPRNFSLSHVTPRETLPGVPFVIRLGSARFFPAGASRLNPYQRNHLRHLRPSAVRRLYGAN